MSLIIPGNEDFSKMAKEAGAPPPQMQPQQIPLDRIIVEISAQVAQQAFAMLIQPYEERIKRLEAQVGLDEERGVGADEPAAPESEG